MSLQQSFRLGPRDQSIYVSPDPENKRKRQEASPSDERHQLSFVQPLWKRARTPYLPSTSPVKYGMPEYIGSPHARENESSIAMASPTGPPPSASRGTRPPVTEIRVPTPSEHTNAYENDSTDWKGLFLYSQRDLHEARSREYALENENRMLKRHLIEVQRTLFYYDRNQSMVTNNVWSVPVPLSQRVEQQHLELQAMQHELHRQEDDRYLSSLAAQSFLSQSSSQGE